MLLSLGGLSLAGSDFARARPLSLVAYLALEGPQPRRLAAELFWSRTAAPRQSLSVALSQMRGAAPSLVRSSDSLLWVEVECDAVQFLEATNDHDWARAAALYRGPFLAGVDLSGCGSEVEQWLLETRESLEARAATAFIELAERRLAEADLGPAARLAERATAVARRLGWLLDDALLVRLYLLLTATGNPVAGVVRGEAEALGLELPAPEPQTPVRKTVAHNLPGATTRLVGRQRELDEIRRVLESGNRLVSITGLGGNGKTRLALEVARRAASGDRFDQVYFTRLEDITDPRQLFPAVCVSIRAGGDEPDATLAIRKIVGDKRTLLVLDNFEQLNGAAPELVDLLHDSPNTTLLLTSREPLGVKEETLYPLSGLSLDVERAPDAVGSTPSASAGTAEAVALYVECARRTDPGFELSPQTLAAVTEVCELVAGSPLAIEQAAALTNALRVDELVDELRAGFEALEAPRRTARDRQANLRVVFERSWSRLKTVEAEALAGSTVFVGGFTRAAGAEVLGLTVPVLAALIDRSLLRRQGGRYELHPLVRRYAEEKLVESGRYEGTRERHARWVTELFAAQEEQCGRRGELAAMDELAPDYQNLAAAWRWAAAAGRPEPIGRSFRTVLRFLQVRQRIHELNELLEIAASAAGADGTAPEAAALRNRITFERAQLDMFNDPAAAEKAFEELRATAESAGEDGLLGTSLLGIGVSRAMQGDMPAARERWLAAVPVLKRHDPDLVLGACYSNLALTTADLGEYERWADLAEATCRARDSMSDLVKVLANQASHVAVSHGDYPRAHRYFNEAIRLELGAFGRPYLLARLNCLAGYNALNAADMASAEQHLSEATRLLAATEEGAGATFHDGLVSNWAVAHLLLARGHAKEARELARAQLGEGSSRELFCWLQLEAGELDCVSDELADPRKLLPGVAVPRNLAHATALHHLLTAQLLLAGGSAPWLTTEAEADRTPEAAARAELARGLRVALDTHLVPLVLEAFVVAAAAAPSERHQRLLRSVSEHPAARYHTRLRAAARLAAADLAGGSPPAALAVPALLEEAHRLVQELAPSAVRA